MGWRWWWCSVGKNGVWDVIKLVYHAKPSFTKCNPKLRPHDTMNNAAAQARFTELSQEYHQQGLSLADAQVVSRGERTLQQHTGLSQPRKTDVRI